ncbi:gamma-glutamyl-gamma-aminobutyrate hydrolase family protein [Nocardioides cynanchi]|uniref:gamma-glutamyl-gamma-aminobutyrate hydrolase family protein n=1 Tax=Nocardioides cynanchi TaxID=2558918 RepID=UPI0012489698|nr:gamma-glutamyl-gamma-aminobutyrate hydrolase family protein [Nocardioides cynanchi]
MSHRSDPPLIGITTYREHARWGVWDTRADVLHAQYADAVIAAGGVPVLLPPASASDEVAAAVVARIDGLVVSGGADVDPGRYGAQPHPCTGGWREDRDAWETALLGAADAAELPTLGVCRGMQLMAVAAGGSLLQHTPELVGHEGHNPGGDAFGTTEVSTAEGSRLRGLLGARVDVGCHHHQTVADHPGFEPSAWAADGSLEAMERSGDRFCLAVQWHPEVRDDHSLFAGLVAAAADRAAARMGA